MSVFEPDDETRLEKKVKRRRARLGIPHCPAGTSQISHKSIYYRRILISGEVW